MSKIKPVKKSLIKEEIKEPTIDEIFNFYIHIGIDVKIQNYIRDKICNKETLKLDSIETLINGSFEWYMYHMITGYIENNIREIDHSFIHDFSRFKFV